jgi:hypothetical protein
MLTKIGNGAFNPLRGSYVQTILLTDRKLVKKTRVFQKRKNRCWRSDFWSCAEYKTHAYCSTFSLIELGMFVNGWKYSVRLCAVRPSTTSPILPSLFLRFDHCRRPANLRKRLASIAHKEVPMVIKPLLTPVLLLNRNKLMPRRKTGFDEKTFQRYMNEKRGVGKGDQYTPWYRVRDVASVGASYRVKSCWTHNRETHLFSSLELQWFLIFDWTEWVVDIREQFPLLPHTHTLQLAEAYEIPHPRDCKTKFPVVMTSDFRLTIKRNGVMNEQIRTVKYARELRKHRVREKFQIEKLFWEQHGIPDWAVVTEYDVSRTVVRNIEILRGYIDISDRLDLSLTHLHDAAHFLTAKLADDYWLIDAANECDKQMSFQTGAALTLAYHLIATRLWKVDMNLALSPRQPIRLQTTAGN